MGRRIPTTEIHLIHPILSFSLLAAGMAAAIAIISGLCGFKCRKNSSKSEKREAFAPPSTTMITPPSSSSQAVELDETNEQDKDQLPLPPAMMMKRAIRTYSFKDMTKSMSDRKIAASLSMKVTRSLSMARTREHNKEESCRGKKGKLKMEHQDSIWMKTIILGERCKVPDHEEEAVIYEGKGKKISAYHPRTASSLSISRQCSFIDQDAIQSRHEMGN